jgi:pimeloyl-ACP methyl ester carboxylesterase
MTSNPMPSHRRAFLQTALRTTGAALVGMTRAPAQTSKSVQTPILNIGYQDSGDPRGFPIILLHGFPDDVHAYDDVAPPLVEAGHRVLVPFLRGYGSTRFRDPSSPRTGEQAAIGQDLIDFADALGLGRFAVGGFDWGGRAACIAAALYPRRVRAAVLIGGYSIQNTIAAPTPSAPETERALWYQWYFNTERGRMGLGRNRRALCRLLWQEWSPTWHFSDETYLRTAPSFDNPDFVDVVIHSYRHRNGNAAGEARFQSMEKALAERPKVEVPTIVLHGGDDGVGRAPAETPPAERAVFPFLVARRVIAGVGHFMPREKPEAVSGAMLELMA